MEGGFWPPDLSKVPTYVGAFISREPLGCTMQSSIHTNGGNAVDDKSAQNNNPRGIYKGTREEWLEAAMAIMGVWLNDLLSAPFKHGKTLYKSMARMYSDSRNEKPSTYKFRIKDVAVSCSLQAAGIVKSNALAHVHLKHATGNKKHEIRMGVHVGGRKTKEQSSRVADILLHEMIHTVFPHDGHKGGFRTLAKAVGLEGKMTATIASDALKQRIDKEVLKVLGRYPHKEVKLVPRGKRGKGSRLIKCECTSCGCVIRLTRKWIQRATEIHGEAAITCPIDPFNCDIMEVRV
jgi:hypothetical protein